MTKLDRMTLGDIGNITDITKLNYIGEGLVKISENFWNDKVLMTIEHPQSKEITNLKERIYNDQVCLEKINNYLKKEKMYIGNVEFSSASWKNFHTPKLKGLFYKERV